ncbi:MAG: ROK family protein [Clostridiales bacterium]|nr:ROK family protein [Clostridiales bacterium]
MVYIGIDLGGTGIKIGVVDEKGLILNQGETPTLAGRPYEDIIGDMGKCMLDVMAKGGFTADDIAAIGIGIPGIADEATGNVIFCTNLGWTDVPLRSELQKYLNKPVFIDNDATVAGFAESICGVSAGSHSSVFMTLGTGVGGGIVIDGRPWSGFHGVGSEIGHIPMDIGGEPCTCGNYGCVERYCSATAIIRMGKQMMLQHPDSMMYDLCGGDVSKLNAKIVFDAAKENDDYAMKVFHKYVDYLCKGIYTIIAFLDPEMIVLGGGVSKAGSFLLDAVRERIPRYLLFKTMPYSRIEIAQLGADAGMIGAAMLGRAPIKEA